MDLTEIVGYVFLAFIVAGFNFFWIRAALTDNSKFDKKETVQWLLGNIVLFFAYKEAETVESAKWFFILGALLLSVGMKIYEGLKHGDK